MKAIIFSSLTLLFLAGCTNSTPSTPCSVVDSKLAELKASKEAKQITEQQEYFGKRELKDKYPNCKIPF